MHPFVHHVRLIAALQCAVKILCSDYTPKEHNHCKESRFLIIFFLYYIRAELVSSCSLYILFTIIQYDSFYLSRACSAYMTQ